MITRKEMDATVTMRDQLADPGTDPVILINVFNVVPSDVDAMLAAWVKDAEYFRTQPGLISTQLHRGIAGSCTFINYAVWENLARFRAAFTNPEFQNKLAAYPESTSASPHLFRKLAVPGICVA